MFVTRPSQSLSCRDIPGYCTGLKNIRQHEKVACRMQRMECRVLELSMLCKGWTDTLKMSATILRPTDRSLSALNLSLLCCPALS